MDTACQTDCNFLDLLLAYCVPADNPSCTCEDELTIIAISFAVTFAQQDTIKGSN